MNTTRRFAIASLAVMAANLKMLGDTKAQTQVISNTGQVVSTGDVVIRQSAGGQQYVYDAATDSWQAVSNDLQVVSTGNVTVDQAAAASQVTRVNSVPGICHPGEYIMGGQNDANCVAFCAEDGCSWVQFCCDTKKQKKCCGR